MMVLDDGILSEEAYPLIWVSMLFSIRIRTVCKKAFMSCLKTFSPIFLMSASKKKTFHIAIPKRACLKV